MPSNNHTTLPRYVDDPPHFLLWSVDEFAPIGLGLLIGIMVGSPLMFLILGWISTGLYRRFRDGKPDGYILHWLYWRGFIPSKARTIPNPYMRRFYQ